MEPSLAPLRASPVWGQLVICYINSAKHNQAHNQPIMPRKKLLKFKTIINLPQPTTQPDIPVSNLPLLVQVDYFSTQLSTKSVV